ncbi:MAG: ferritin-like domain-containing protein [Candidatus Eremiobacteraeota bacterium]|nr:ferritin-like domain-containing protein [Candidatus Eremiobacteraeota bacterium]
MTAISRAEVLGVAGALMLAAGGGCAVARAAQKGDPADIKALNAAVAVELAAIAAYTSVIATKLPAPAVLTVLNSFLADHRAHLETLSTAVTVAGGTPTTEAAPVQTPTFAKEGDVLAFVYTVERLAAGTHLGTLAEFKNRDLAKTSGSILGVETTHVALLAEALRQNPAYPSGFITP